MRVALACPLLVASSLVLFAGPAAAQGGIFAGMQKGLDFTFSNVSTTTTFSSGAMTRTDTRNLFPALTLNIDTLLYPGLRLNGGGVFEVNVMSANIDGNILDSTISRNRPYFVLRSTNPVFSPGVGYFRRVERSRTRGFSNIKLVNDEYDAYLGWYPEGGPRSDFQFLRAHTFDGTRSFQDLTRDFGALVSNYTLGNFGAYYRGAYLKTDDPLIGVESRQITHAGRLSDSGAFINKRLVWNGTYNVNYQDVTTASSGNGGEVALPVIPFSGLAGISDLPGTARLIENSLIVDTNLTASAGIDIGLATPPEDTQARNIGLDFLNRTEVNRFLVWVDRDLPFEISNSFSWEIYSSSDNIVWTRESIVSAAPFGPFENRFEIDFPGVIARYIKLVTRPLSVAVPDAVRFTDIFVTEVQPFLRRPAGEIQDRITQTTHIVNADVRMRLLDAPSLYYEGFFLYDGPDPFDKSTRTISNGVSLTHTFRRIFSLYGRGAIEQGEDPRGERFAAVSNATFTVDPIPTFRSSLLYTGLDEEVGEEANDRRGIFLQNTAQIYRGVNVLFGFGWNYNRRETGEVSRDHLINASATIVPLPRASFTVMFDRTSTERSGTFTGLPNSLAQRFYAAVAMDPLRTLHVVLGEELLTISSQRTRRTHDIGVNWLPFPEGALQLIFTHNEALRPLEFGIDRSTMGTVRWNLSRRSYFDVSYQRTRSEFTFQTTEFRIFSVSVRLFV